MSIDICIPSCKTGYELSGQIGEMIISDPSVARNIVYSCIEDGSAAVNRNRCLDLTTAEYVVMVDDDITGFFPGWHEAMVKPLIDNPDVIYVSARLMTEYGDPQMVMGYSKDTRTPYVPINIAPSAAWAFRNDGTRFWEEYKGSGFEDTDFHFTLKEMYGNKSRVILNNLVKLTHQHEMKNQNKWFNHNGIIFERRWPGKRAMLCL